MARQLGRALAARRIGLVYGGGKVGMMGEVAKTVVQQGGAFLNDGDLVRVAPSDSAQKQPAAPVK